MAYSGNVVRDWKPVHFLEKTWVPFLQLYKQDTLLIDMPGLILFAFGAAIFISTLMVCLIYSKSQRKAILGRIRLRQRRTSGASTPPRALTPQKEKISDFSATPQYKDVFPPSRRGSLANITTALPPPLKRQASGQTPSSPTPTISSKPTTNIVGLSTPLEACTTPTYTPTEFSNEEIKALGDFPDYAELSGVPLPKPYFAFDINQALPRPYRPFRWAYHQTMCMLCYHHFSRTVY